MYWKIQIILMSLMFFGAGSVWAVGVEDIDGYYGRSGSLSFVMGVTIISANQDNDVISSGQLTDAKIEDFFKRRVRVKLRSANIPYGDFGSGDYYSEFLRVLEKVEEDRDFRVELKVHVRNADAFNRIESNNKISLDICVLSWNGSAAGTNCEVDKAGQVTKSFEVVDEAPTGLSLSPNFRSLTAAWVANSQPKFSDGSTGKFSADKVVLYIVELNSSIDALPAKLFAGGAASSDPVVNGGCTLNHQDVAKYQCLSCGNNVYLDVPQIKTLATANAGKLQVVEEALTRKDYSFALDPEKKYIFFASYLPDSIKQPECVVASPGNSLSLSGLLGEKDPKLGKECFMASAAYGTSMHPQINHLRDFRDQVLIQSYMGRRFLEAYYSFGPLGADLVDKYPASAVWIRAALWPVIKTVSVYNFLFRHESSIFVGMQ